MTEKNYYSPLPLPCLALREPCLVNTQVPLLVLCNRLLGVTPPLVDVQVVASEL